jgi:hypothetical protein
MRCLGLAHPGLRARVRSVIGPSKRIRTGFGACLGSAAGILLAGASPAEDSAPAAESLALTPALHRPLDRASDFAPAGVLLDHTHERGDWTFLYRYERVSDDRLMQGEATLSPAEFAVQYPAYSSTPLSQLNQTHTFGVMYAPHERFTVAMLLPFVQKRLDQSVDGVTDRQETSGIGDALLIVLIPFMQKGTEKTQFNVALSLPTGSIRVDGSDGMRLPYTMQHGSGSWDVHWGLTYTGKHERLSWGAQVDSQYRTGKNDLGYELGAIYQASSWLAGELGDWLSVSARLGWAKTQNIKGADPALATPEATAFSPLNAANRQGGTRVEMGPGLNLLLPILGGQRFSFEALFPLYQSVDGPQLAPDVKYTVAWQWIY